MRLRSKTSSILIAAIAVTALAACSTPPAESDNGLISVVASTNVYGDLAARIGGNHVEVTSIIDDPSQDPHSFEADARVQLALSKADVVIENGGGYDAFIDQLLGSLDVPDQILLSAVEVSPLEIEAHDDHGAFNEHVWYDFPTIAALVSELEDTFTTLDPDSGALFESNADALRADLAALGDRASDLHSAYAGTGVAVTEPVSLYLLEAVGLENVTPDDFSEAIEEGSEISASVLNETLGLFASGAARVLVYNEQTTSPETEQLLAAAKKEGTPLVSVTEILPADNDYVGWMTGLLDSLELALAAS